MSAWRGSCLLVGGALALVALSRPVRAEDAIDELEAEPSPKAAKRKPTVEERLEGITLGARVLVRETLASAEGGPWTGLLALDSVRVNLGYEKKRLRTVIKVDIAGGSAKLRDAYAELALSDDVSVRLGQFKLPASTIEIASRWDLPTLDRGFLSDVYDDGYGIAGRRVGAFVTWRRKRAPLAPRLTAGVAQALGLSGDAQAGTFDQRYGLIALARGSIEPVRGLELGAWGQSRLAYGGASAVPQREWTSGVDATLDLDDAGGPRGWLELTGGSSALDATPMTTSRVHFGAARGTLAWRIGARTRHGWYLEPYATGAVLDPDLAVTDDVVWESALGVNLGRWKRWRAQLQGELRRAGAGRPTGLAGSTTLADREALTLQLGAAF